MKCRPLSLPRVPAAQQLTANLLADPVTPTAAALTATHEGYPSLLRRARFVQGGAHFSYVSPLPLAFPYEFPAPENTSDTKMLGEHQKREMEEEEARHAALDATQREARAKASAVRRMDQIENALRGYEVQVPASGARTDPIPPRRRAASYPSARVVAFSPECHAACLPHLAVGDVHTWIASTSGRADPSTYSSGPMADAVHGCASQYGEAGADDEARRAFSDWAAGRAVPVHIRADQITQTSGAGVQFFSEADAGAGWKQPAHANPARFSNEVAARRAANDRPYAPFALRYGGDQFGEWAGQLGDGRAITLVETQDPTSGQRWEVQLKGAGRTPYSRFGDGLATLKSSVREFLASEYMAALGIPTSRTLAVTSLPDLHVARETLNPAALALRIAPSWLRIGSFQIHSAKGEWESVRLLGEYVARELFGWADVRAPGAAAAAHEADKTYSASQGSAPQGSAPWAHRLIRQVALRNARTCALWQAYGFMHGVLNTDNISLLGDTIDYGPYGFMDVVDEAQICNHSDYAGRYSYRLQPTMLLFAVDKLLEALAPVLGFEQVHGRAPRPFELLGAPERQRAEWADHALDTYAEAIRDELKHTLLREWAAAWGMRLDVATHDAEAAKRELIDPLLEVLAGVDMTRALRGLCAFPASLDAEAFAAPWLADAAPGPISDAQRAAAQRWLARYAAWLRRTPRAPDGRMAAMRQKNPAFTLRNWITDEAAERLEHANDTAFVERVRWVRLTWSLWGGRAPKLTRQRCVHPFEDLTQEDARLGTIGTVLSAHLPSCSS